MQRKKMFLVVCISALLTGGVNGQNFLPGRGKWLPEYLGPEREKFLFPAIPGWDLSDKGKPAWGKVLPALGVEMGAWRTRIMGVPGTQMERASWPENGAMIPANRVVTHFGFFCRRELELEKTIRLPLRFRLGSLEYCNRLEGEY